MELVASSATYFVSVDVMSPFACSQFFRAVTSETGFVLLLGSVLWIGVKYPDVVGFAGMDALFTVAGTASEMHFVLSVNPQHCAIALVAF
ncbi:hypothetical protein GCM10007169_14410 [Shewanella fodinae]|nr:hypothetical protein GCM10007169_14410 [Shewanella fodinae]